MTPGNLEFRVTSEADEAAANRAEGLPKPPNYVK